MLLWWRLMPRLSLPYLTLPHYTLPQRRDGDEDGDSYSYRDTTIRACSQIIETYSYIAFSVISNNGHATDSSFYRMVCHACTTHGAASACTLRSGDKKCPSPFPRAVLQGQRLQAASCICTCWQLASWMCLHPLVMCSAVQLQWSSRFV